MNVSKRSISKAHTVRAKGVPELAQAVEAGKISVSAAAEIACKPAEEQQEIITGKEHPLPRANEPIADDRKDVSRATKKKQRQIEAFENNVARMSEWCKCAGAGGLDIPCLSPTCAKEIHHQLRSAQRDLDKFVRRFEELQRYDEVQVPSLDRAQCVELLHAAESSQLPRLSANRNRAQKRQGPLSRRQWHYRAQ